MVVDDSEDESNSVADGDGGTAGPTSISDIEAWVIADKRKLCA